MAEAASSTSFYIGVDVGTGSVRAAVFDARGEKLGRGDHPLEIWRPRADFAQQASTQIWQATCEAVRTAVAQAAVEPAQVRGLGFDATCSLVVLDERDRPVSISPGGEAAQDIVMWMDHRAIDQARRINASEHPVLQYVGGTISPEMQAPKLLWLKENMPEAWSRAARCFDLPDFLVYRATGADTRSLCSTVCKWTYLGHEEPTEPGSIGRWDPSFFEQIGLEELPAEHFARIGRQVRPLGEAVGTGLTKQSASDLGLAAGTAVSTSAIDAHAGGIGLLGTAVDGRPVTAETLDQRVGLIGGTSSCHMAVSPEARFIPGVWGPYYSAMVPEMWLTEGGQSASGALIDHVIFSHRRSEALEQQAEHQGRTVYELLNERITALAAGEGEALQDAGADALTRDLHVFPDFHGNRSPLADPTLRGMISGLRLENSVDELARLYLATLQAVAYGTRHIIEALNEQGYRIETIIATGGGMKNPRFVKAHADAAGCRLIVPQEDEAVLLGSAILGGVAAGDFNTVTEGMGAMSRPGESVTPEGGAVARYHDAKYHLMHQMHADQQRYRGMMGR